MYKFKETCNFVMVHPDYGEARIEKTFKVNGVWWVTARVNDHLVVETPRCEWTLKDYS